MKITRRDALLTGTLAASGAGLVGFARAWQNRDQWSPSEQRAQIVGAVGNLATEGLIDVFIPVSIGVAMNDLKELSTTVGMLKTALQEATTLANMQNASPAQVKASLEAVGRRVSEVDNLVMTAQTDKAAGNRSLREIPERERQLAAEVDRAVELCRKPEATLAECVAAVRNIGARVSQIGSGAFVSNEDRNPVQEELSRRARLLESLAKALPNIGATVASTDGAAAQFLTREQASEVLALTVRNSSWLREWHLYGIVNVILARGFTSKDKFVPEMQDQARTCLKALMYRPNQSPVTLAVELVKRIGVE